MKRFFTVFLGCAALLSAVVAVSCRSLDDWTAAEREIIGSAGSSHMMRVLTIGNREDSLILRSPSTMLSEAMLESAEFASLAGAMLCTVTSPEQDGVGIAGPQVGILRRIVAVQRFDKEGEPFVVYPNIRITEFHGETSLGAEGCLSVPECRGSVLRYRDIEITYTSMNTLQDTTERVQGFTAVIFQHECDHLDGILYTDRMLERLL